MMTSFDEWKFLAGLGIFLFGIFMMEESIKLLAGRSFKTMIRRYTGTRFKGLMTGVVSTAVLQSSSAVSLMVLAFVGAGLMTLVNAIAVIMGAMVGTTFTAWIVAVFGFKFKIDAFALPLIGIGGLGLIVLSGSARYVNISKLVAAFGFLFLGLDFMKTSVEDVAAAVDLSALPDVGLWIYLGAGILMTVIMQSSSATIAVILTTLFSGIIDFTQGAAMVIGANVGTTVTILLGSVGGIPAKKQAAVSALVFKTGTALAALLALPLMFRIIDDLLGLSDNPVLGMAAFHTLFNFMGVILFFPVIPALARYLERIFPERRTILTQYILNTTAEVPEAALEALRKEVLHQLYLSTHYIAERYGIRAVRQTDRAGYPPGLSEPAPVVRYADLTRYHAEIFSFYAQVQTGETDRTVTLQMESVIRSSRSVMNATKNLYDLRREIEDLAADDNMFMLDAHSNFKNRLDQLVVIVDRVTQESEEDGLADVLNRFFQLVEEADKQFIQSCAGAVAQGKIMTTEVTRLLMANRLFTQSGRMMVLSMQSLLPEIIPSQDYPQQSS
ncbi:MAG: Na/Pi symporter [Desulfomonilaceae bacterium]|nr:Na/Pi symporter [Desulfomonilaceae bacterium]